MAKNFAMAVLLGGFALLGTSIGAMAEEGKSPGDVMVRVRGLLISPDVTSSVSAIGGRVEASQTAVPEVDISYFFTSNVAVELIAATNRHSLKDVGSTAGTVNLGKVTLLPPTLTAQYHFFPKEKISPYLGAGLNYTFFYDNKAPGGIVQSISYDNSVGYALQAGVDFQLAGNWYANVDLKKLFLETRARINGGAVVGNVRLDPWIVGLGIGYKF